MSSSEVNPLLAAFDEAAESAAASRPEVDLDLARELMQEAATMLHNGLVLDGVDEQDVPAVVAVLADALTDPDPAVALRDRAQTTLAAPGDLADPQAASDTFLVAASILQI